jgi:predicted transcriptional regulator
MTIADELGISRKTADKYVDDVSKMPLDLFRQMVKFLKLNEVTVTNYIMEGRTI